MNAAPAYKKKQPILADLTRLAAMISILGIWLCASAAFLYAATYRPVPAMPPASPGITLHATPTPHA